MPVYLTSTFGITDGNTMEKFAVVGVTKIGHSPMSS